MEGNINTDEQAFLDRYLVEDQQLEDAAFEYAEYLNSLRQQSVDEQAERDSVFGTTTEGE